MPSIVAFGWCYARAVQALRLNVGGKLLTNYLKEVISYRQWNMMDEFEVCAWV